MNKLDPKAMWLFFFQAFISWFFTGFFLASFIGFPLFFALFDSRTVPTIAPFFGLGLFIFPLYFVFICVMSYLWAWLSYENWKYEFTHDAIKIEKGIIWKKYISIPYERVQNVDIYRGVFARLFGLSDLQIQTAGYSGVSRYGQGTEGRLPGLSSRNAELLRDDLIKKVKGSSRQGI